MCLPSLTAPHLNFEFSITYGAVLNSKWKLKYFKFKVFGDLQRTAKK